MGKVLLMTGILIVCGAAIAALLAVGWVVATADSAPNLSQLHARHANPPTEIFASDGSLLGYVRTNTVFNYVSPNQIPKRLKQATIAIEDRRFYQHGALDYQGILRAGVKDLLGQGNSLQGASTLTMQLVNQTYIPESYRKRRDLKYKIAQAKLALQLENKHSKDWILNQYLGSVPYGTTNGEEAVGVGAAALMFFNKPVWKLNLAQMSLLAGLPQSPTQYNPTVDPKLAKTRRNAVLQSMVQSRYIPQGLANAVIKQPLQIHPNARFIQHNQPYIFDYIQQQLINEFGATRVQTGGLKVYTTIDLKKQAEAEAAIHAHEGGPVLTAQPAAALASVDPSNGHVLAIASSATYDQTKFDYPVQAERQTGSAFKVFALMTLIHDYDGDPNKTYYTSKFLPTGWLPADPTWSVHTAEQTYQGNINITHATTVSDNTVFAQLAADLGWTKLDATAHAMGITSPLDAFPSEVIGGLHNCCTMLEMADAYATLANQGVHVPTTIISKVVFPDGKVADLGDPPHTQVFSDGESYEATQVLKTVIQSGTGTAAGYGCPAAGKTGTAENLANAWFVGYTPKLSTAVWVGYPQGNIGMGPNGFGGTLAAPIWHDYMSQASDGYCGDFPQPTTSWSGVAFTGPRSSSNSSPSSPNSGTGATAPPVYNNPQLFAPPPTTTTKPATPRPKAPTTTVQSGGAAPPGGGHGNGHGGGRGGHGGGGGKHG
ncbi:MAG: penicillin-binding protein [Solirubrobacterales bacterium]|nr:penicillin-binding protein [Solirubrobacterales bacterium]MBV9810664.1 penicillin-binding protein [Solirubrobacterales bacterium]